MDVKFFSKHEVKTELGATYQSKIVKQDTDLKQYQVWNVFNGRTSNLELIEQVMIAAQRAIVVEKARKEKMEAFRKTLGSKH